MENNKGFFQVIIIVIIGIIILSAFGLNIREVLNEGLVWENLGYVWNFFVSIFNAVWGIVLNILKFIWDLLVSLYATAIRLNI